MPDFQTLFRKCRCGACHGKVGRPNLVTTDRKANWKYPASSNVITGHGPQATAVLCDVCIELELPGNHIREVVEFRGGEVVYQPTDELELLPPEPTCVVWPIGRNRFAINCLLCGHRGPIMIGFDHKTPRCPSCRKTHAHVCRKDADEPSRPRAS